MSGGKATVVIATIALLISFVTDYIVFLAWQPILNHSVGKMIDTILSMSLLNLGVLCAESIGALFFNWIAFMVWLSAIMLWRVKKDE